MPEFHKISRDIKLLTSEYSHSQKQALIERLRGHIQKRPKPADLNGPAWLDKNMIADFFLPFFADNLALMNLLKQSLKKLKGERFNLLECTNFIKHIIHTYVFNKTVRMVYYGHLCKTLHLLIRIQQCQTPYHQRVAEKYPAKTSAYALDDMHLDKGTRFLQQKHQSLQRFFSSHPLVDLVDYPRIQHVAFQRDLTGLINTFRKELFAKMSKNNIAILYGSYANDSYRSSSDIDLIVVCDSDTYAKYRAFLLPLIEQFLIDLHRVVGAHIEDEVPTSSKSLIDYNTMVKGARAYAFRPPDGSADFQIKPLTDYLIAGMKKGQGLRFCPKFLKSENLRLRLIFNALTSPSKIVGHVGMRHYLRDMATASLRQLAAALFQQMPEKHSQLQCVLEGPDGQIGEMWLGYKAGRKGVVEKLERSLSV